MPDNYEVSPSSLSPYMQNVRKKLNLKKDGEKLIADLGEKKNYVISAYTLKCYLRAGVKITGNFGGLFFRVN